MRKFCWAAWITLEVLPKCSRPKKILKLLEQPHNKYVAVRFVGALALLEMLAWTSFVGQLGRKVTNMISCQLIEFHSIGSRENFGKEYNWKGKPSPSKYVFEAKAYRYY